MKEYDVIAIGTGSVASVVDALRQARPSSRVAIIDKDAPGGICLTRGCIPTKILVQSAEVVRTIERAEEFGVDARIHSISFEKVMARMRSMVDPDIESIRRGLSSTPGIDYYRDTAEFIGSHTMTVGNGGRRQEITAPTIILGLGSEPTIPPVEGSAETGYLTSDTFLELKRLPKRLAVVGGGYIAAELGHFAAAMGSRVTVVGRNSRFLAQEDPEVSQVVATVLGRRLELRLGQEVVRVARRLSEKRVTLRDRTSGTESELVTDEILVASGRGPTTHWLKPERAGLELDSSGWIKTNEFLETNVPGIHALGDSNGHHLFKHKANYEARLLYLNLVQGKREAADYRFVPHAVFTDPEVAAVGLTEPGALAKFGREQVYVGRYAYRDTAKGQAMGERDGFVKVIASSSGEILGAHIVGPHAAILIQEIATLLYTPDRRTRPIVEGMHIHPALSEVVERAFLSLQPVGGHRHTHGA